MKRLPLKEPGESYIHEVDFEDLLGEGEFIQSVTLERKVLKTITGVAITASDEASVAPSVLASADTARVLLMSGSHNHIYFASVRARTNLGNDWVESLIIPVWDFHRN